MAISPLLRLIETDYQDLVIDLIWNKVKRKNLAVVCSKCRSVIPVNQFKIHLRNVHNFNWWFREDLFTEFIEKVVRIGPEHE